MGYPFLHAEGRRFEPVITHQLLIKIRHLAVSFFWPKFLGLTLDLLWTCVPRR